MDGRVFCVTRSRTPEVDAAAIAGALGGGGHAEAASAIFQGEARRRAARLVDGLTERCPRADHRGPDHVESRAHRCARRDGRARAGRLPALRTERDPRDRGRPPRRRGRPRGSRPRGRTRPLARAGQGDHERRASPPPSEDDAPRGAPAPARRRKRGGSRSWTGTRVVGVVTRSDLLRALGEHAGRSRSAPGRC